MKHLLPPAFAVLVSTAGTLYGCHAAGMPLRDVMFSGLLAFSLSFAAVCAALAFKVGRLPPAPFRPDSPRNR